jgi:hypothetical protein
MKRGANLLIGGHFEFFQLLTQSGGFGAGTGDGRRGQFRRAARQGTHASGGCDPRQRLRVVFVQSID